MNATILPFNKPQTTVEKAREICEKPLNENLAFILRRLVQAAENIGAAMLLEADDPNMSRRHLDLAGFNADTARDYIAQELKNPS